MSLRFTIRDLLYITTAVAVMCWIAPYYVRQIALAAERINNPPTVVIFRAQDTGKYSVFNTKFDTLKQVNDHLAQRGYASSGLWTVPTLDR